MAYLLTLDSKQKILIIRFSSIGDIVLTTPIVRALKQQLPNAEIHYLTKESFAGILKPNPYITKIHSFKVKLTEVVPQLKKEGFNYVIDLHKNLRSNLVKLQLRKKSYTFDKLNFEKWLIVNFKIDLLPKIHIVDRYFGAVKKLGVKNDGKGLDYFIPKEDEFDLKELPKSHQNGYVAFVIGAKHATKRLPFEKLLETCKKIDFPIVLLGGPDEAVTAQRLVDKLDESIFSAVGEISLHESASLLKNARLVVTYDTGLMHIAAAFDKDIVSIWGSTVPEFGMYPYLPEGGKGKSEIIEVKNLKIRPCSKIGYEKCPHGHFKCMRLINEDEIAAAVFRLWKKTLDFRKERRERRSSD